MRKNKVLALLIACLITTLSLVGCAGNEKNTNEKENK